MAEDFRATLALWTELCSFQNPYVRTLTPNVIIFEGGAFKR